MDLLPTVIAGALMGLGAVICIIGGVGMHRLPDFYTRTHAASLCDTLGAPLILVGLMFISGPPLQHVEHTLLHVPIWLPNPVITKLGMVLLFLVMTSPISGHALGKAAWKRGLRPLLAEEAGGEE